MSKKSTTGEFISKSKLIHGDKYDYSKVEYVNNHSKVCIICPEHGEFWMRPINHLQGNNCPKCSSTAKLSTEEFVNRAKKIHDDRYDYSKVNYINCQTKVCIICPEHGEFWQKPIYHLSGGGCNRCYGNCRKTTEEFIEQSKKIHNNKYDYSKVEYINYDKKVCIVCPIHGEFWQSPDSHLQGCGCAKCSYVISKPENELCEYLNQFIEIQTRNRTILNGKELDIYIPSKNIAIEYNGLRWHSEEFGKDKFYHLNKTIECNKNGVKLLQIFEDEYINHKEIILSKVSHILGIKRDLPKIMGRKCEIEIITKDIAQKFLNDFHIQGFTPSTVYLGAVCNKKLIAVMAFKEEIKGSNKWELTRFASDYNYICCGVGGKLFNWFIRNYNPMEVKSFADRRWTLDKDDNIYTKLGFELVSILEPDYKYYNSKIDKYKRVHKFNFRKQTLHKKYGLPLTMTESEMAQELGYSKIWDCGLLKFVWKMK